MLNTRGEIACAAAANLFWIAGETLLTPAPDAGAMDGIMAGAVLAAAERLGVRTAQVRAERDALASADTIFLTNCLIGIRPSHLAGRSASDHPLVRALAEAVADVS